MLVRDVPGFEEKFACDVLAFVKELGFTGEKKEPQRIVQEGCLPFDPTGEPQKVRENICVLCFLLGTFSSGRTHVRAYRRASGFFVLGVLSGVVPKICRA